MNGATTLPSVNMMSKLKSNKMKTMGPSHHFFLFFKKPQNSAKIKNLLSRLFIRKLFLCQMSLGKIRVVEQYATPYDD